MENQLGLLRVLGCEIFMGRVSLYKRWENKDGPL
jgi:hypothetical protein